MKRIFTALIFLCSGGVAQVAVAADNITGFSEYQFGTPYDVIAAQMKLTEEEASGEIDRWFGSDKKAVVVGEEYSLGFGFVNDALAQVNLTREMEATFDVCLHDLLEVFSAIQASYGQPDMPLDTADPKSMYAAFTAPDGASVKLAGVSFPLTNFCSINVAYTGPKNGESF